MSKHENEEVEQMHKKNEELVKLMKQIEEEKPQGWGFDRVSKDQIDSGKNEMEVYSKNLNQAIKKIELKEKVEKVKRDQEE